ncbi:MAG: DinB family protein, partial [Acidobacteriaceae bacterium]|nr:DinB family protein [Acidobacteriaceae bacterium]
MATLDELRQHFHAIEADASTLLDLSPWLLGVHASPGSWSASECIEHLLFSINPYFRVWERELAHAVPGNTTGRCKLDFWGHVLLWALEPPPKFRFRTPQAFDPKYIADTQLERIILEPDQTVEMFLASQRAVLKLLDDAEGIALDRIKIVSPFSRHVRYSVWSSFCVTAAHE